MKPQPIPMPRERWMRPFLLAAALFSPLTPTFAAAAGGDLRAGGAAAAQPLWQRWFLEYGKAHPTAAFSFETMAATDAVRRVGAGELGFAATTSPLADAQLARTPTLINLPVAASAVAVVYNVLIAGDLRLTPELVSGIFAGRITRWKDPAIAAANPGVLLPDLPLSVFVQAEDTGDAATFRAYLARSSGAATGRAPFAGAIAADPRALIAAIKDRDGTIGFLDAALARNVSLYIASIRNRAGFFVQPSMRSVSHAAVGVRMRDDFRASIVDASGVESYPIASFTNAVVDTRGLDQGREKSLVELLRWVLRDGQKFTAALGYAPLPALLSRTVDARLAGQAEGSPAAGSSMR